MARQGGGSEGGRLQACVCKDVGLGGERESEDVRRDGAQRQPAPRAASRRGPRRTADAVRSLARRRQVEQEVVQQAALVSRALAPPAHRGEGRGAGQAGAVSQLGAAAGRACCRALRPWPAPLDAAGGCVSEVFELIGVDDNSARWRARHTVPRLPLCSSGG